jgi:hypothetical protein
MKRILLALLPLMSVSLLLAEEPPDWSKRDFAASANAVFAAALKSIQSQHHEIKSTDVANHTVEFHVGTTAWSWGYNMKLTVTAIDEPPIVRSRNLAKNCAGALKAGPAFCAL